MDIEKEIDRLIEIAIQEDMGRGDITSEACIPADASTCGQLVTKQGGTLAGLPFLARIFQRVDPQITVELLVPEGSYQKAGISIATIKGPARGILSAERTAMNFLQHASGVATITAAFVRKVAGYDCLILDTRATLPGLRALEKYAIQVGGGTIHRYGLDDRFIIKRNYLAFLKSKYENAISEAIRHAQAYRPGVEIEVEVSNIDELGEALQEPVAAIMLDKMSPEQVRRCVKLIHTARKKAYVQSSSGIVLETIREYAETGVDGISVGSLAYAADNLPISLRLISNNEEDPRLSGKRKSKSFSLPRS